MHELTHFRVQQDVGSHYPLRFAERATKYRDALRDLMRGANAALTIQSTSFEFSRNQSKTAVKTTTNKDALQLKVGSSAKILGESSLEAPL